MARAGRALELIVAHLEQTLVGTDGVTVESPAFLADKITGQRREFDVLVTIRKAHHCVRIAFEVKDQKSLIDAPLIEQFVTKTSDTDIQDKFFVAANGYNSPALLKAEYHKIKCLTLQQVLDLPWLLASDLRCITRKNKAPSINLRPANELEALSEARAIGLSVNAGSVHLTDMSVVTSAGKVLEWNDIAGAAWKVICDSTSPQDLSEICASQLRTGLVEFIVEPEDPLFVVWRGSSTRHLLGSIRVTVPYSIDVQTAPFAFRIYQSAEGEPLAELAVSGEFDAFGRKHTMSFVKATASGMISAHLRTDGDSR
jgi:hypothetical protein